MDLSNRINGLDLFSGIGGISQALAPWVRPIAYCENDKHAQSVLLSRMARGELFPAPIWDDVRTLRGCLLESPGIDIVYGGFPCQDISVAGNGKGLEGERSGLFFEISRLVSELRPRFVFLENVPAITARGLSTVLGEFTRLGYDTRWTILSAKDVGAHHLRRRWFLLAHANGEPLWIPKSGQARKEIHDSTTLEDGKITDSDGERLQKRRSREWDEKKKPFSTDLLEGNNWDDHASFFHRMDYGIPHRGHRLRGLGNAVVPIQAREAFKRLMGFKQEDIK